MGTVQGPGAVASPEAGDSPDTAVCAPSSKGGSGKMPSGGRVTGALGQLGGSVHWGQACLSLERSLWSCGEGDLRKKLEEGRPEPRPEPREVNCRKVFGGTLARAW